MVTFGWALGVAGGCPQQRTGPPSTEAVTSIAFQFQPFWEVPQVGLLNSVLQFVAQITLIQLSCLHFKLYIFGEACLLCRQKAAYSMSCNR
jgi:hypothetical protein